MPQDPRHQCLVYEGSPAPQLSALSALIRKKLDENYRCQYLHSPSMVAGMRSYLFAAGIDVTKEILEGSLVLSSTNAHLLEGRFSIDRMIGMLEEAVQQALQDGYQGLWASGDMSREFGPEKDFSKLLDYEWRLEELFQTQPALSGICQYHADTLPPEVMRHGLVTHPSQSVTPDSSKDKSPDMKHYKDQMGQAQTAPSGQGKPGKPGQKGAGATGSMGEDSVGGSGPSGTSGLPPGKAPQFEGGHPSSKNSLQA